ncbi:septal ring lytic transglycosylase RlpA family protein [Bradyrhizobium sp. 24]|nr:septal ring lytic transglycosylase RlpA family protein [Bradyrhizobium sp. 37]MCK1380507.1 septal ring lytic transglycosylase RlpA family protein [Bradyrhizobium sp. 24]MCK1769101.1 septal ring lytic transglycosylase RlpA family protein [Bradyrhizobium sp. 134]UPJ45872.1 septal ring lytic transglycosylase RlpA family protein [Bradyrhizobium sp. 40]
MVAIATLPAWIGLNANTAAAEDFNERWSIIPKAHAEPAPEGLDQTKKDEAQPQLPNGQEPLNARSGTQSYNRVFSGKASYYSYSKGKTASGSSFDRNLLTAAHRRLPFGTRVRVIDLETKKSVVVRITDRGPWVRGRVLDLSLAAARTLGITDRGVAPVRAEVL